MFKRVVSRVGSSTRSLTVGLGAVAAVLAACGGSTPEVEATRPSRAPYAVPTTTAATTVPVGAPAAAETTTTVRTDTLFDLAVTNDTSFSRTMIAYGALDPYKAAGPVVAFIPDPASLDGWESYRDLIADGDTAVAYIAANTTAEIDDPSVLVPGTYASVGGAPIVIEDRNGVMFVNGQQVSFGPAVASNGAFWVLATPVPLG
jgi:hypothetical protein